MPCLSFKALTILSQAFLQSCFPGGRYYRPITGPGQPCLLFANARSSSELKVWALMAQLGVMAMVFVLWD